LLSTGLANQGGEADETVDRFQAKNSVICRDLETTESNGNREIDRKSFDRAMGIEPTFEAWEARNPKKIPRTRLRLLQASVLG
jgi:hypothetical protein